jgi:hypothetical protein
MMLFSVQSGLHTLQNDVSGQLQKIMELIGSVNARAFTNPRGPAFRDEVLDRVFPSASASTIATKWPFGDRTACLLRAK